MERLLLVSFERDPDEIYLGFEPQCFHDPIHGTGLLVIAWRVDGRVDVYHQPGLTLDPAAYGIAGQGLAHIAERTLRGARLRIGETGVDAYVAFEDVLGRRIEVKVRETSMRPRKPFGLLAPMGAAASAPPALPLVFLHDFCFVRRSGTEVAITVAGRAHQPDRLPLPMHGSRVYFLRYSPDPFIVTWNPSRDGPVDSLRLASDGRAELEGVTYDLLEREGRREILRMHRRQGRHQVIVDFAPPFPHLAALADGADANGAFLIRADPSVGSVSGEYNVVRDGKTIRMTVVPSGGWSPNETNRTVRCIYRLVPVFRQWPATYRWDATLQISTTDEPHGQLTGRWSRDR